MIVNVFTSKVLVDDTIFNTPPTGEGTAITWSSKPHEDLAICREKVDRFLEHGILFNVTLFFRLYSFLAAVRVTQPNGSSYKETSSLIYNFSCEITKFSRQRSVRISTKMAAKFQNVTNEDVMALKDDLEYLNIRKSTSGRILLGILSKISENYELKQKFKL